MASTRFVIAINYAGGMRRLRWLLLLVAACGDEETRPDAPARPLGNIEMRVEGQPGKPRVLVYTFENYWRHYSNLDCRATVWNMSATRGFTVATTNDPLAINATHLADFDVVVFSVTSGSGLTKESQADLEAWIRKGGGTVGFHSASATEQTWPFYVEHVGTQFRHHAPGLFDARVENVAPAHPITAGLPDLHFVDEWYLFTLPPEAIEGADMLLALDESTLPAEYPAVDKIGYHPIAWTNDRFGGRMFYSAFGHTAQAWQDPTVIELAGRAIEWAASRR